MKVFFRIVISLVVITAVLYVSLWKIIDFKARPFLIESIKNKTGKDVNLDSVKFVPPIGIKIENICSSNMNIEEVRISLDLLRTITGRVAFDVFEIKNGDILIVKEGNKIKLPLVGLLVGQSVASSEVKEGQSLPKVKESIEPEEKNSFNISAKELILDEFTIRFKDLSQDQNFRGSLHDLNGFIRNPAYPFSSRVSFDLSSDLKFDDLMFENDFKLKGWMDFSSNSMNAHLEIENIPYEKLAVYYPSFWRPKNLGLKEALLSFESYFTSVDNDLTIEGTLSLLKYDFDEEKKDSTRVAITEGLIQLFKQNKKYPGFNFKLKTKFDNPRLDFSQITAKLNNDVGKGKVAVSVGKEVIKNIPKQAYGSSQKAAGEVVDIGTDTTKGAVDIAGQALKEVLKTPKHAGNLLQNTGSFLESIFVNKTEN